DRLPRSVNVTVRPGSAGTGGVDFAAQASGRAPDVRLDATQTPLSGSPLDARVEVEGLPSEMHGEWSLPGGGAAHIKVSSPGHPIGAVEARVANFLGAETKLAPYVPKAVQYVDLRQSADETQRVISGRVDGVSLTELTQTPRGLDAHF